jgi:hypothetical protein
MNTRTLFRLAAVLAVLLFVIVLGAIAQPPPPALPGMPNQAPIDGGLGLLAAAGGAYAWRKLRNRNQN